MEVQEKEGQEQSPDKVEKKFKQTIANLANILGLGDEKQLLPSNKVGQTEMDKIASELLKEEREKNSKEIKDQLSALLKGYADLNREISNKEKELEKIKNEKRKEFSKQADALFGRVIDMNKKQKEFKAGLAEATGSPAEDDPQP